MADPRFVRYADRKCNEEELVPLIQAEVAGWRSDELVQALRQAGVPCSLVRNYEEVLRGAHGTERGLVAVAPHAELGSYETVRNPILLDHGTPIITRGAPLLGEHTDELLAELGYAESERQELKARGAAGGRT